MTQTGVPDQKPVHLDDILIKFNLFGCYYLRFMVLMFIANLSNNVYSENYVFTADKVQYRCKDDRFSNNTCSSLSNSTDICTEWVYDEPRTFVAEFQLACQDWKRTLVGTAHGFGYMVGLLIVGPLSDRWGRKKLIVLTGVIGAIFGVARSFVNWYWMFIAFEFLEAAIGDISSPNFMMNIEVAAKEKRVLMQILCSYGYTTGTLTLSLAAYLFPYWRTMLRVIYTPGLLFFLYLFLMDESPRWLLSKGRKEEAIVIIEKAAKKSKVKLDKGAFDHLSYEENNKGVKLGKLLKETFSSKTLLQRFLICLVWWTTSTFVNFGLNINSVFLQGNKYINFALIAVVSIPGNMLTYYFLTKLKRKICLILCFWVSAVLCLAQPFIPQNLPWLSILFFMAGKLMSSAYFDITYVYTSELFPTYTRNSMHALCSSLGRVGSILAPQTPLLMTYWHGLPSFVFGCTSLVAGLVTMFAPNTADDSLPDNVRQAEAIGSKQASSPPATIQMSVIS